MTNGQQTCAQHTVGEMLPQRCLRLWALGARKAYERGLTNRSLAPTGSCQWCRARQEMPSLGTVLAPLGDPLSAVGSEVTLLMYTRYHGAESRNRQSPPHLCSLAHFVPRLPRLPLTLSLAPRLLCECKGTGHPPEDAASSFEPLSLLLVVDLLSFSSPYSSRGQTSCLLIL